MGILSQLTQRKHNNGSSNRSALNATGNHALSSEIILTATNPNAVSPMNPGNWTNLRSFGVETTPRYIGKAESDTIRSQAKAIGEQVGSTISALRALSRTEKADAKVQKEFREYQAVVAEGEVKKIKSNAKLGRTLHGQRAQYARAGAGLYAAEKVADQRVIDVQRDVAKYFA